MHVGRKTQKREKSAMSVSLYGNLLFVVIELIMAIVTSSQAVLLDAVYDGVEFRDASAITFSDSISLSAGK